MPPPTMATSHVRVISAAHLDIAHHRHRLRCGFPAAYGGLTVDLPAPGQSAAHGDEWDESGWSSACSVRWRWRSAGSHSGWRARAPGRYWPCCSCTPTRSSRRDRLIEELWPGHPADKATDSLQVRLSELRKALRSAGEADRLVTRPPGYLLRVAPGELDALRFEQLAAEGDAALAAGDAATAAQRLDRALGLWRGPALADLDAVPSARAEAGRLEEQRLAALESRAEALLACGRHRDLIAELEDAHRGPSAA